MHLLCHHQTCAHTGVCRGVPLRVGSEGLCLLRDTQSLRPQGQLLGVGAGTVATGDEGILALRNGCKRIQNGSRLLNTGRVRRRSAQDEIVIQEGNALCFEAIYSAGEALFNKGFFLALGMDQNQVGIAELGGRDCLAGTGRLDFHSVAIGALEESFTEVVVERRMTFVSSVAGAISPV